MTLFPELDPLTSLTRLRKSTSQERHCEIGMWVFVYGLMIYLPACSLPADRGARLPRWWHYPLAVILPLLFMVLLVPWGLIKPYLHPDPGSIHFPPIQTEP